MKLSATLYSRFLACPKNAEFSQDPDLSGLNRTSLRAALGNVSHRLAEKSMGISQDLAAEQIGTWFEENWERAIEEEYSKLVAEWFPNTIPKPVSWPGFFATRAAVKTLVVKNSKLMPRSFPSISDKYAVMRGAQEKVDRPLKLPLVEQYLESRDLGIVGKPDFVFLENGTATIYDYKFGRDQVNLERHKLQMHFYVLLVESVLEVKVGKLAIVASANKVWDIPIDLKYLSELKEGLIRVNEALTAQKVVAVPSVTNCRFCPYKSKCDSFKEARIEFSPGRPMSITGRVSRLNEIEPGMHEVQITTELGTLVREIMIVGVPSGYELEVGANVFVSDGLDYLDEKYIGFGWNSRISVSR